MELSSYLVLVLLGKARAGFGRDSDVSNDGSVAKDIRLLDSVPGEDGLAAAAIGIEDS